MDISLLTATYTPVIEVTSVDFSIIMDEIVNLIPKVLPAIIGVLAVRKGISFIMGMIKGA